VELSDPTSLLEAVQKQKWENNTKNTLLDAYKVLATEILGLDWKKPIYQEAEKPIFIPLESEIDALIAGTGLKTSVFLHVLKETGAKRGEAKVFRKKITQWYR